MAHFPQDSCFLTSVVDEFVRNAGNPFLPSWEEFAAECLSSDSEKVVEIRDKGVGVGDAMRFVFDEWKVSREANVNNLMKILRSLQLHALHEKLIEDFNLPVSHFVLSNLRLVVHRRLAWFG